MCMKESSKSQNLSRQMTRKPKLDLELIQSHMAQKPVLRGEVGCVLRAKYIEESATKLEVCRGS